MKREEIVLREAERQHKQIWDTTEANDRKIQILISAIIIFTTQILASGTVTNIIELDNCLYTSLLLLAISLIIYGILRGIIAYAPDDIARGEKMSKLFQASQPKKIIEGLKASIEHNSKIVTIKAGVILHILISFFISFILITILIIAMGGK